MIAGGDPIAAPAARANSADACWSRNSRLRIVGGYSCSSPAAPRVERLARGDPQAGDRLRVVVQRLLRGWRQRQEEPGVEPLRLADRRDPVGHVLDQPGDQPQPFAGAQVDERTVAAVHRAVGRRRSAARSTDRRSGSRRRCRPAGRATRRPPRSTRGSRPPSTARPPRSRPSWALACAVVEVVADRFQLGGVVGGIDPTAGEHVHPAGERGAERPPQHEHLEPAGTIAHEHHGRRRAQRYGVGIERFTHGGDGSPVAGVTHWLDGRPVVAVVVPHDHVHDRGGDDRAEHERQRSASCR